MERQGKLKTDLLVFDFWREVPNVDPQSQASQPGVVDGPKREVYRIRFVIDGHVGCPHG